MSCDVIVLLSYPVMPASSFVLESCAEREEGREGVFVRESLIHVVAMVMHTA